MLSFRKAPFLTIVALALAALLPPLPAHALSNVAAGALSEEDLAYVQRFSDTINRLSTMQGRFMQIAPDGSRSEGYFVLHRPGRLLFRYLPPSRLEIVSDGRGLVVRDASIGTHDLYPISQTPLRFLLEASVDLVGEGKVLDVSADTELVTITMEDSTPIGDGRIAVSLSADSFQIEQWTVIDPQGQETTIALFEVEYGLPTDPNWFFIDHLNRGE